MMDNDNLLNITIQLKNSLNKIEAYKRQTDHMRKFINQKRKELTNPTPEEIQTLDKVEEDLCQLDMFCDNQRLELEDKINSANLGQLFDIAETLQKFNL